MKKITCSFLFIAISIFMFANFTLAANVFSVKTGNWSDSTVWNTNVPPQPGDNVTVNDTVTYDLDSLVINDLTVGNGVSGLWRTVASKATKLVITGNLLVNSGAGFKSTSYTGAGGSVNHLIYIHGNITNNGNGFDCRNGSAGSTLAVINFIFIGTTNSTLAMNAPFTTTNGEMNALTFNKSGSGKIILATDIFAAGGSSTSPTAQSIITFINGKVETGPNTLVSLSTTSTNVVGGNPNSYVIGNFGRGFSTSGASAKDFPIGDENGYRPATFRNTTSGLVVGHYLKAACFSGNANTGSSTFPDGLIDKVSAVRYYKITYMKGPITGGADTMTFNRYNISYGLDDGVAAGNFNLRVAYSTDEKASWRMLKDSAPDSTDLSVTPKIYVSDDSTFIKMTNNVTNVYVALARLTGTTENTLGATSITKTVNTYGGWNLLSVPVKATNMTKTSLFPTAISLAYAYSNGYVTADTLANGLAYWLKFTSPESVNITGTVALTKTIPVTTGWNMIGSYDNEVLTNTLITAPPGLINSAIYFYNNGYDITDTLRVGKGYWVKMSGNGTLTLPTLLSKGINNVKNYSDYGKIILRDAKETVKELYVVKNSSDLNYFELPPSPPTGASDLRFADDRIATMINEENILKITSFEYPITLSVKNCEVQIKDNLTGNFINRLLRSGEQITINDSKLNRLLVKSNVEIPFSFEVFQNYPNPFNPSTKIKFAIPEKSNVTVTIFNVIGEKIATLINNKAMEMGVHTIEWNAENYPTGIYFYKVEIGELNSIKKMILIK